MNKLTFELVLTEEAIRAYAAGIEAPLQTEGGVLLAPATMPVTFWQPGDVPWLSGRQVLLHGKQTVEVEAPLTAGSRLDCELALIKTERKSGRSGAMTLYTQRLTIRCGGQRFVSAETVLIAAEDERCEER